MVKTALQMRRRRKTARTQRRVQLYSPYPALDFRLSCKFQQAFVNTVRDLNRGGEGRFNTRLQIPAAIPARKETARNGEEIEKARKGKEGKRMEKKGKERKGNQTWPPGESKRTERKEK